MLGQAGSGKLRVSVGQSKLAAKVAKRYFFFQFFFLFHWFLLGSFQFLFELQFDGIKLICFISSLVNRWINF